MYTLTTAYWSPTARGGGTSSTPSIAAMSSASGVICSGVASPTTWMVGIPDAGYSSARVSKNCRSGALGGSSWAPELRSSIRSAGAARMPRISSTPPTTSHGRRCVQRASLEKTPSSGATSPNSAVSLRSPGILLSSPGRIIRAPASASSAGTRVSATSSATTTTLTPAAPTARRIRASKSSRPDRLIATVIPENITVRPAVRHRRHQGVGAGRPGRPGGASPPVCRAVPPGSGTRSAGRSRCTDPARARSRR